MDVNQESPMRVHNLIADLPDDVARLMPRRAPFIALVDDVMTPAECEALVARIEALSPAFAPITTMHGLRRAPDVRNNDRVMFDDVLPAADLSRGPADRPGPDVRRGRPGRAGGAE
jgi:hypothetical protein